MIDNNVDGIDTNEETEDSYVALYKTKANKCYFNASTELRRENRQREEQKIEEYKAELNKVKEVLKADPVFRGLRTKQEKYRYSRNYYNELEKDYKMIATKVSFREMIDDAIFELEKEKCKV